MTLRMGSLFIGNFRGMKVVLGLVLLCLTAWIPAARAQSESINATIRGRVADPSDQSVTGATVTAVNNATAYTRTVTSGDDGYYVIPSLPLGTYTVTISKDGFSTLKLTGIVLQAGTEAVVDGALKLGAVNTSIEVSGGAPVLDPARTNIGGTITGTEIQSLPLTSRNPYNWIMFQPGVSGHPNPELGIPRTLNTNGFVDRINYQMDGMVDTESDRYGLRLFPISSVYVSEIQTVSNSFAPEFGGTTGNIYNVITGSGTNELHGMFQWIRGPVDTTARPILLSPTQPKPNLLMNSYGMNAGGPILRDKLFIFGAYEHLYRALPVPNSVNATNQSLLEAAGIAASQFGTAPSVQHAQFLDVRGDWDINAKNRVFVRVNYFRNTYPFNTAVGGLNTLAAESDFKDRAHVGGLQWVSTISPQLLNEFRFSYPYRNEKHIAGSLTGPQPAVTISGIANINGSTSVGDVFAEKIPSWNDNFTYIHGPHTFKAGFGYSRIIDVQQGDSYTQYVFKSIPDYQAAVSGANPMSYSTVNALIGDTRVGYISNFFNLFAQDSWQVRPSLLVTYGVRYDRFLSPNANANAPFPLSRSFNNPSADVSPRLGLAWRLGDKTVARASWGIFYDAPPTNLWYNALFNDGSGRSFNASLSPASPGAPSFPQALTTATAPAIPSIYVVNPNFKNAYAMTTTLQISRQLSKDDAITFAFVNTGGRQLQWLHNVNLINPIGTLLDGRPVFLAAVNANTRANPAFNNITMEDMGASSSYNALEVNYEHRFSHGLLVSGHYIYSHTISDAPDVNGFEQNQVYVEDTTNRLRDRGNSYVNRPHSFTASTVWSPRVTLENSFANRLLNDNEFAILANIASGDQQNVTANANLNGDPTVTSITRPLGIGRSIVRGPKIVQFDMRYTRTLFALKERFKVQFLTEATNIFNHPNVTSLNTVVGVVTNAIPNDPSSPGCPTASNNFTFDPTHCGQLASGSLPSSFPRSSTVLQGRILNFGLGVRW
jgi:Carboxypeptidase regulatory-like domain/TonB dependent receptor-like, beta-barrel